MALPLPQFLKQLSDSTLMSIDEIKGMISSLPEDKRPKDGEAFARDLVRQKRLTAYQAQEVYAGRGKSLVLGNYVVLDKLGQGGMGMVLKAEHRRMKRAVALKVLSPKVTQTPEALRRFQREVEAAAKLRHPNIVAADDADEANGVHFLVMEYVEGSDLSALVKKSGTLTLDKALHCVIQAARGLEYAHTRGVVHRDIKPANLLLDKEGNVKILDMGLARLDSAGANQDELTGTGQIMGTVDYMAPEQAVNTKNADARADIYALGVTLWYLLTARPMYQGDTAIEKLMAHQTQPIPSLIELNQSVSAALQKVFEKLVAKTPAARYQTMTEVIAELERCRGGGDSKPSISAGPGEDTQLHNFLRSVKDGTKSSQTTGKPVATSTKVVVSLDEMEKTLDSGVPQIETDPETQNSLPGPLEIAAHKAATAGRTSAGRGSGKAKNPPVKLIAAGALGAVLLLFGIVVLVRDKDGNKVAEVVVPPGGTVEVKQTPPTPIAPTATVPKSTATPPKSVVPSTGTSSAPSVNFTGRNLLTPDVVDMHVQRDAQGFVRDAAGLILDHTGVGVATPVMHCLSPSVWKTDETDLTAEIKELASPDPESYVRIGFEKGRAQLSLVLQGKPGSRTWRINSTADYSSSDRKQYAEAPAKESAGGVWKLRVRYDQGTFEGYANDELVISAKNVDFDPAIAVASARKSKWLVRSFQSRRPEPQAVPSATAGSSQPLATGGWTFGEWKPLFDGKSLAGWTGETSKLKIDNGVLVNDGQRGVVIAPGTYRDCEVELDFRLQDKGNSGLGICYSGDGDPSNNGLEVQLLDDPSQPNVGPDQRCGSLYRLVAVQPGAYRKWPEWNRIIARSLGDDLEVVLNGTSVVKTSRKLLAAAHPTHVGVKRDSGSICLFPHTSRSEYFNFRVREARKSASAPVTGLNAEFALDFDGRTCYVTLPIPGTKLAAPMTLEAWVISERPVQAATRGQCILGLRAGDKVCGIHLGDNTLFGGYGSGGLVSTESTANLVKFYEQHDLPKSARPVHVAWVVDEQGISRAYVNGVFANGTFSNVLDSRFGKSSLAKVPEAAMIGAFPTSSPTEPIASFNGIIDEIRISRTARYRAPFTPERRLNHDGDALALYHCDEGQGDLLKDSSANGYHGKIINAKWVRSDVPEATTGPIQAGAHALDFDGQSAYVTVPTWTYRGEHPLTVEAWMKWTRPENDSRLDMLLGNTQSAGFGLSGNFSSIRTMPVPKWNFVVHTGQSYEGVPVKEPLPRQQWLHLAGVYDGKSEVRLYVNGVLQGRTPTTGSFKASSMPFTIGANPDPGDKFLEPFLGQIDEVRISKVARYDGDFSPAKRHENDGNTVALFHFDQGSGNVLQDSSGNNHHGKIVGAKWVRNEEAQATLQPLQTVDLLALLDLQQDRVPAANFTGANNWARTGDHLTYTTDGKSGRVTLPVDVRNAREFEIVSHVRRLSGNSVFTFDLTTSDQLETGLDITIGGGIQLKVENDRRQKIGDWPAVAKDGGTIVVRVRRELNGDQGSVDVSVDGMPAAHWRGAMAKIGKPWESHPSFPGKPSLRIFCFKDSFEFKSWQLRVFSGQAQVLRQLSKHGAAPNANAGLAPGVADIDLLSGVDVNRDAVVGKFTLAGGLRQTDQVLQARIYLPTKTIPAEYDLNYSVARTAPGGKALMLGFVWQGKQGSVVIDGFSNPPSSGLEMVDGKSAKENGTYKPGERITFGSKHELVVRVRNDGVTALCDGAEIFAWKGKANQLSTHAMWDVPRKDQLFVGFQGPYVVHAARLTPVATPPVKAPVDAALKFDGKLSHVQTPLVHGGNTPLTIEFTLLPGPRQNAVVSDSEGRGMGIDILNNAISFLAFRRANDKEDYVRITAPRPLAVDRAYRIAAVYDSGKLRLYVDGKLEASAELKGEYLPSNLPFVLGASPEDASIDYPFTGTLDEVRFSTIARYQADYEPVARLTIDADTLALYHFDEGQGEVLTDASGNNHHGKIIGAEWVKTDGTAMRAISVPNTVPSQPAPATSGKLFMYDPAFPLWLKNTQTMLVEAQIEEVSKKLVELNPGFDGKLTAFDLNSPPRIKDGAVVELRFYTDHVTDLSPLRALTGLKMLLVQGNVSRKGQLSDLSPLQGLQLTTFECQDTQVADLSPLVGMPITSLNCSYTMVSSLDPIKEMKLTALWCRNTQIADLSILSPMPLKSLYCAAIPATNITALNSCKDLKALDIRAIKFTPADLESLKQALPNCEITIVD